ncbi:MAG: glycosyltransferase family 4 protein [Candidatus Magasanikbacteria bacterium]
MKTLIVTLEYPPTIGGIASYAYNFAKHLNSAETIIYAPLIQGAKQFDAQSSLTTYRRRPFFWIIWPHWLKSLWQIWRIVKKEKIEIIHVHHVLPMGYIAYLINRFLKIPYIIFLHGSDLRFATSSQFKRKKFGFLCRSAQKIVVNSQFSEALLKSLVEQLPTVEVLYPCPSDDFVAATYLPEEINKIKSQLALNGKKVIISTARLVERKGHALFIPALIKIIKEVPNAVWLIIGDGPEKPTIVSFIQKNNLQSVVRFLPSQPPSEVVKFYHCADVFVLLTHQDKDGVDEAWGIVFMEAAVSGLPVVAGKSGGVGEAVAHLSTGLVIDAHNTNLVATSVIELLKNPDYAHQMGSAGKERVKNEFTWKNQMKNFIEN